MSGLREGEFEMTIPTRAEMSEELNILRVHMVSVAEQIKYFGGLNPEAARHAAELFGAARKVAQWSRKLKLKPKPLRKKVAKKR